MSMKHIDTFCILEGEDGGVPTEVLTAKCRIYLESSISIVREDFDKNDEKFGCVICFTNGEKIFVPDKFEDMIKKVSECYDSIGAVMKLIDRN